MWDRMAERLVADSKEIDDFVCDKSAKNCRDKINNLSKKYKTVKDKSKPTVEGSKYIKRGCQHPSNKFEILWQVAQNSFSPLLSYFVAQYVLIIVV